MADAPRKPSEHDAYEHVAGLVEGLISRYGLHASRSLIVQVYEDIFRDALAFPLGSRPPRPSRINHDGTPIQFAATVGRGPHTLQFLGEPGGPSAGRGERLRASRACIESVAGRLGLQGDLSSLAPLLDALAPEDDLDLLAEPAGAYWVGAAFPMGRAPHLRIYVNARWGPMARRWARLDLLAQHFRCAAWPGIAARLAPDLQPLGVAITLCAGQPPVGRIYLSAYGARMSYYEALANAHGGASLAQQVRTFGQCVLSDDYAYPTQSAVSSFGLACPDAPEESDAPDFKFELCAHCLFDSDLQAAACLCAWLGRAGLDGADYSHLLDLFSGGQPSDERLDLHCYAGVGMRRGAPYGTIYIKPGLGIP